MRVLFFSAIIVIADQISKSIIKYSMHLYESIPVIPGFFHFTYVVNRGMAFGIDLPIGIGIFSFLSIIISCFLVFILWRERENILLVRIALALVLGGAIGNLIDRILFSGVVDFLDFMIGDYHWYIFNIADSAVTVGIILMLWHSVFIKDKVQSTHSII
mgnify:FL=1